MEKNNVNTELPVSADGTKPGVKNELNQTHIDYDPIKIYSERAPYSKTSKVTEVFGPKIQSKVNSLIGFYAKNYNSAMESGMKEAASQFENGIKKIHTQFQHLSNLKDEWMMLRGGGTRGKGTVSNITDRRWPDAFFTEKGDIHITSDFEVLCEVPTLDSPPKLVNEIALDWESKGDGEGRYMSAVQDFLEAGQRGDKNPPFDADYFISNLLDEYWPQSLADKWGGVYALHDILPEMIDNNGGTAEGLDLSIEAFNPERDIKLHKYYVNRLNRAFNPDLVQDEKKKENNQVETETQDDQESAENNWVGRPMGKVKEFMGQLGKFRV